MTIRAYDHYIHTGDTAYGAGTTMQNIRNIILHCLVYGTGGVPAAGWTLEHDEGGPTGTFVLANGERDFFICFAYRSAQIANISIATSFEGVDSNGFIVGEAARSGAAPGFASPFSWYADYFLGGGNSAATSRAGWSMLADANSCALAFSAAGASFAAGPGLDTVSSSTRRYGGALSFGKTSLGYGHVSSGAGNSYYLHPAEGVMVLNYPQTGLLIPSMDTVPDVTAGVDSIYSSSISSASSADFVYEDQPTLPVEIYMQGSSSVGAGRLGFIRGLVQMPYIDKSIFPRHILKALGMADEDFDTMLMQDLSKFRLGSDGCKYAYAKLASGDTKRAQVFLTDNPLVW